MVYTTLHLILDFIKINKLNWLLIMVYTTLHLILDFIKINKLKLASEHGIHYFTFNSGFYKDK